MISETMKGSRDKGDISNHDRFRETRLVAFSLVVIHEPSGRSGELEDGRGYYFGSDHAWMGRAVEIVGVSTPQRGPRRTSNRNWLWRGGLFQQPAAPHITEPTSYWLLDAKEGEAAGAVSLPFCNPEPSQTPVAQE